MAIIPQISIFSWENQINNLGDLTRLQMVLDNMPDEELMQKLEGKRKNGRNDYPVRAMWNMLIAMIVFGHDTFASVIRELNRNVQLRAMCGFQENKIPGADNVSRFVIKLQDEHQEDLLNIFVCLSEMLYELLPDFGESVAVDSKWVWSIANRNSGRKNSDGRSETEAAWGVKEYSGINKDGNAWSTKKKCFGYKIHALVDTKYELPIAFEISDAAGSDPVYAEDLIEKLENQRPHVLKRCEYFMADKAYDSSKLILKLKELGIKAIIDKRNMKKSETEVELPYYESIYYNDNGEVFCYSSDKGERHTMVPAGYEGDRDALRFRCPAEHYGCECSEKEYCTKAKNIRVPLKTDVRIFTQVNRQSYRWSRLYKARTSVERVFSRLDVSFGFEARRVRGKKKMILFSTLALVVMDTLAVSRIKQGNQELMRSLIKPA